MPKKSKSKSKAKKGKSKIKEQLKNRTKRSYETKDKGGKGGKSFLDISRDDLYKMTDGKHLFDIIPYRVKTDNHPQGLEPGEVDYVLDVWVHRGIGAMFDEFICMKKTYGKPCSICEEIASLYDQKKKANKKEVKVIEEQISDIRPSRRVVYNIIDHDDDVDDMQVFAVSHFLFEKELVEEADSAEDDDGVVAFSDPEDGYNIKFRASETEGINGGDPYFKFKSFSLEERDEQYDEDIIDEATSLDELLIIPDYDEVKEAFSGGVDDEEEDDEDDMDDEDDVEDDDDEDEEDEPKKTNRKSRKKGKADKQKPLRTRKGKGKKKAKKIECPAGGELGEDIEEYEDCEDCEVWDECSEASK